MLALGKTGQPQFTDLFTGPATPGAQVFKVFTVDERGWDLFEAVKRTDLEGMVPKRKSDPYASGTVWLKIKNPRYTQAPGRGDLFNRPRQRIAPSSLDDSCTGL